MTEQTRLAWTDVRDVIRARILDRDYAPGDKLPRDLDLAAEFGCARATVHRAMQDLSLAGLVERRRKGGTHVRTDPVTRTTLDIPITRREIEHRGGIYGYQLISVSRTRAPLPIMAKFGVHRSRDMIRIKALHLSDTLPYIFEDRWVDVAATPGILDVDLSCQSANEWLVHNRPYSRLDVRFSAKQADAETAELLSTSVGNALFVIERTTWCEDAPITTVEAFAAPGYQLIARS